MRSVNLGSINLGLFNLGLVDLGLVALGYFNNSIFSLLCIDSFLFHYERLLLNQFYLFSTHILFCMRFHPFRSLDNFGGISQIPFFLINRNGGFSNLRSLLRGCIPNLGFVNR